MTAKIPPPRVLWQPLLKQCEKTDLEMLHEQTLIKLSLLEAEAKEAWAQECADFLQALDRERRRRPSIRPVRRFRR